MEPRSFLLPTTAALSLAATSACSPTIVGDWDLTLLSRAGGAYTYAFPYANSSTSDGHTYDILVTSLLTIEKDLTGTFTTTQSTSIDGGTPHVQESPVDVVATRVSGKKYGIVVDEGALDLSCTIDENEMTCDSPDNGLTLVFEKAGD